MSRSNRAVTSREYKLMLNVERFKNRVKGSDALWELVKFLIDRQQGDTKTKIKEERRRTWYVDTPELAMRRRDFNLRLRHELDDEDEPYKLTLKYRASDRYLSAGRDLSSPHADDDDTKFEEDILLPFISKFSHSTSFKTDALPPLETMDDVTALFPGLKALELSGVPVGPVNNFRAYEVKRELGKMKFGGPKVKACLSFWYWLDQAEVAPPKGRFPLVAEFSFDYDLDVNPNELEQFPSEVVAGTNLFFKSLQKQAGWINFNATTKTAYAYDGF